MFGSPLKNGAVTLRSAERLVGAALPNATVGIWAITVATSPLCSRRYYHRVLRDGVRLFSRDLRATTAREGQALSRYCDYLPQLAKIDAAHRARVEGGHFGR